MGILPARAKRHGDGAVTPKLRPFSRRVARPNARENTATHEKTPAACERTRLDPAQLIVGMVNSAPKPAPSGQRTVVAFRRV